MNDDSYIIRQLKGIDRRIAQTEVKEVPLTNIGARVYNDANISIPNNSNTSLTFNQERYDPDGMHSTAANTERLTVNKAGKYLFIAHVDFDVNGTGVRGVFLRVNATTIIAGMVIPAQATLNATFTLSAEYNMAVGDWCDVRVYQNSGGNLNVLVNSNYSPEFSGHRLS
jgi:hypothetical protein